MPPSIAVILTWAVLVGWCLLLGAFAGQMLRTRMSWPAATRVALWTGFALLVLLALIPNFFVPVVSSTQVLITLLVTVLAVVGWWLAARGTKGKGMMLWTRPGWWVLVPVVALFAMVLLYAHLSFGPLTNYDSGLYHLNAIQFAAEYRTIPGLANMSDRYGTNVSAFNLAAAMSNSPWGIEAFRLLIGLFAVLAATDLGLRLADGDRGAMRQPGFYVLGISLLISLPFIAGNPGYWLTSPSPDTASLLMTVVAGAYLADALADREPAWTQVALVTAALAASIRTQLWVFVAAVVAALLVRAYLGRSADRPWWRPAPYAPMPVSWRVTDTTAVREWLLAWARSPGTDPAQTLSSWDWFWPWVQTSVNDWAIRGAVGLLGLALAVLLALRWNLSSPGPQAGAISGRACGLALAAPILTVLVWFFTAPDPRFAWGAILLVGAIPAGFALTWLGDAVRL
ncbi:MAG: hypothetical protein ACKOE2_16780, partial [Actinomycetales bacterium]